MQHLIDRPELTLERPDNPSLTPQPGEITDALEPRQRIQMKFQQLAHLGLPAIQQRHKVLGLLRVSTPLQSVTRGGGGSATHWHTINPSCSASPTN